MSEEQQGISLSDIIKTIFSQKWLALILTVLITLAGTLALYLGYNTSKTCYARSFSITFPGSDKTPVYYPDNTPFSYREMISRSSLQSAKESDQRFSGIDVNNMYNNGDITITCSSDSENIEGAVYTVRVSARYFVNKNIAEDFINSLVRAPIEYVKGLAADQDVYIKNFGSTSFYEEKFSLLNNQVDYLQTALQSLSVNGKIRKDCIQLENRLNQFGSSLNSAIIEMREQRFVHNVQEVQETYKAQLAVNDAQLQRCMREIGLIYGKLETDDPTISYTQSSERIEALASEIAELEENKHIYENYIGAEGLSKLKTDSSFDAKLSSLNSELASITQEFETLLASYYEIYSFISYDGVVNLENHLSLGLCLVISLLAGLIIAAIVAYIVGYCKSGSNGHLPQNGSSAAGADGGNADNG